MGREVKRVPLDFDWPMKEIWEGYITPERLLEDSCPDCTQGMTPEGQRLYDQWYGNAPFQPEDTGSRPLTPQSRAVWAFAKRNVERAPDFYGQPTHDNIWREGKRLADLFNGQWCHHLDQDDVDALLAEDRLRDLTHDFNPEAKGKDRWTPKPDVKVTPRMVNDWDILSMGHDSSNAYICVKAKAERLGVQFLCSTCEGHGSVEKYPGQREDQENWYRHDEDHEPPKGDGWQMWETTSEGSPMSPVFATAEELADWLARTKASIFGDATLDKAGWMKQITGEDWGYQPPDMPGAVFI